MAEVKKKDKPGKKDRTPVKGLVKKDNRKDVAKKAAAKPSTGERAKSYLRGVLSELKKVHWPTRRETMIYTAVVGVSVVFVAALIWVFDIALGAVMGFILR